VGHNLHVHALGGRCDRVPGGLPKVSELPAAGRPVQRSRRRPTTRPTARPTAMPGATTFSLTRTARTLQGCRIGHTVSRSRTTTLRAQTTTAMASATPRMSITTGRTSPHPPAGWKSTLTMVRARKIVWRPLPGRLVLNRSNSSVTACH